MFEPLLLSENGSCWLVGWVCSPTDIDQSGFPSTMANPLLNAVGIVASDMARSLDFYRLLGLDVPHTPEEGHVNISLPLACA